MGCREESEGQRIFIPMYYLKTFNDHDITAVVQLDTLPCTRHAPPPSAARAGRWRKRWEGDGEGRVPGGGLPGRRRAESLPIDCFRQLPLHAVLRFFRVCDVAGDGVVAVHCRTGRGRTAAMIALWLMREYRLTARDATVWLRLVCTAMPRPRGLVANMVPHLHVPLALPRKLCTQQKVS
jgi:hypothetical protein